MCGIAGFSRPETASSIKNGRTFGIALAIGIEPRGRDATGFAWWERADRDNVWYSKKKGRATVVAPCAPLPKKGISTLIAHTRYLTMGSAEINGNNHPVVSEHITAVHNGRIENHNEIIEMTGLPRVGTVDSWAIAAMLSQQENLGASHPTELLESIEGVAAISWLDATDPDVLHLARLSTRPLTVGWTKKGDLVFSSTRSTLLKASTLARIAITDIMDVPEGTYMKVKHGEFQEYSGFKVRHPVKVAVDADMPGFKRKAQLKLPASGVTSYDPSNLDGFDAWEEQIDWDNLVSRRGWKDHDPDWSGQAYFGETPDSIRLRK
jgi:glucosamine 6-phosphate synthetase-like amidotransferase/phosphosugar isomerase protein